MHLTENYCTIFLANRMINKTDFVLVCLINIVKFLYEKYNLPKFARPID